MVIPTLVTLEQALAHLRQTGLSDGSPSPSDADLQMKIDAATQLVCEHINDRATPDPVWTAEIENWSVTGVGSPATVVPPLIVHAILVLIGSFYRFRGDDNYDSSPEAGGLSPAVKSLLRRYRDPALA